MDCSRTGRLLAESAARAGRERLPVTRSEEPLGLGYDGGYDAVSRYVVTRHRQGSTGTAVFVLPSLHPGEPTGSTGSTGSCCSTASP